MSSMMWLRTVQGGINTHLMPALKPYKEGKAVKCNKCGASRDYIENTEEGYRCSVCGNKWKRRAP